MRFSLPVACCLAFSVLACDGTPATDAGAFDEDAPNPLLEVAATPGKADSAYYNPDGIEVEVDLEADLDAPDFQKATGPAVLGQFALTWLRNSREIYLESLAEQASSPRRVEWNVDGVWMTAGEVDAARIDPAKLVRFRIRGINAVLLHSAADGVTVGTRFEVPVPRRPFSLMADAGQSCATRDSHISLDQSVYWYLWNPDLNDCSADIQQMQITVSKMLPSRVTYPEYDQLVADGKVTMVVLFGQIGDTLDDSDIGVRAHAQMGRWLVQGGFAEVTPAPVGRRFAKTVGGVAVEVDLYSPYDFAGLSDYAHYGNFERALAEHEIVAYDGHSMLGASDFWKRPDYPDIYQIFLYGGCLGYEYYIAPILEGKGGWDKLDIMSSVIEVSANANAYAGPFLAKLLVALEGGYNVSWKDILGAVRSRVGDSTFGMSGVLDNCFSPGGSLCGGTSNPTTPPEGGQGPHAAAPGLAIPDASPAGVSSTIPVTSVVTLGSLAVHVAIDHSYIGDLTLTLTHGGVATRLWAGAGVGGVRLDETFTTTAFEGMAFSGDWTLTVVDGAAMDTGTLVAWDLAPVIE